MNKIFKYELYRTIVNKFYFGILITSILYSWQILTTKTIQGISNTAPFSSWSFGDYISQISLLLCIALVFFINNLFSNKATKVKILTSTTSINQRKYLLIKCLAITIAWLLVILIVTFIGIAFLMYWFSNDINIIELIFPTLCIVIPTFIFTMGLSLLLGQIYRILVYFAIPMLLLLTVSPLFETAQLFCNTYFTQYPLSNDTLDPVFTLTTPILTSRVTYLIIGILFIILGVYLENKRKINK
ncbi:MAG: hypothetical protein ACK5LC_13275 [Coprobacillaceae bacterium]